nr:MAG TPA: hypothetical protein [Caudoviricetes sp.]
MLLLQVFLQVLRMQNLEHLNYYLLKLDLLLGL